MVGATRGSLSSEGLSLHLDDACADGQDYRSLAMFSTFGFQNAYGVFQDFYAQAHTGSASQISWIGSIQLFFLTSMGLISGKLVDMGYFRETFFAGSSLYVFSCVRVHSCCLADTNEACQFVHVINSASGQVLSVNSFSGSRNGYWRWLHLHSVFNCPVSSLAQATWNGYRRHLQW